MQKVALASFPVFCAMLVFGCSSGEAPKPTAMVKGKITLKGQAVPAGSTVGFVSQGAAPVAVSAVVAADGSFSLRAGMGMNEISVSPPLAPRKSPEEAMKASMEKQNSEEAASAIPSKYHNTSTSEIKFEVKAGENNFTYDLTE